MFDVDAGTDQRRITFVASVNAIHHRWIELDRTEFHVATAERESDIGLIDGIPVVKVETGNDAVLHRVEVPDATRRLSLGQVVEGEVDGERRFRLMRLHTLQHLAFLGFQHRHGKANRLLRRVSAECSVVELGGAAVRGPIDVAGINDWMRRVVSDDLLISRLSRPLDPERRYWHVDGVGTIACSGHHPTTTGEIGDFAVEVHRTSEGCVRLTSRLQVG